MSEIAEVVGVGRAAAVSAHELAEPGRNQQRLSVYQSLFRLSAAFKSSGFDAGVDIFKTFDRYRVEQMGSLRQDA